MRTVSFKEKKGKSVGRFGTAFGGCQGHSCFDLIFGPLAQASECTCLGLFMHGDMQPLTNGVALLEPTKRLSHTKVLRAALGWMNSAWSIRTGLCLSPEAADGPYIVWMPPGEDSREFRRKRKTVVCHLL